MDNHSIIVKDYVKKFKNFTIKDINFVVNPGKIHAIIGPSGSGKSVIMKSIIGALKKYEGSIRVNGYKAGSVKANFNIGFCLNLEHFPSGISAFEYLLSLAKTAGLSSRDAKARVKELMIIFDLWKDYKKKVTSFSSGMKNRLMLIQAIVHDPDIVILDEPGANLDSKNRKFLNNFLLELKRRGKTVFFSTHLLNEVKDLIDECTIISYGKLIYTGLMGPFNVNKIFVLKTNNNRLIVRYLKHRRISYFYNNLAKEIILRVNHVLELNRLFNFAIFNKVIILSVKDYELTLEYMQNKLHHSKQ
ncbi:ABC transporter ATP-binding protein [Spiroplasma eriocheiris]|uniref:ABC transporter ATP-binding protein n=1 Tax=Spiroplasma eriocheiris TaxID=315358 RepID=A0A0H3XH91_9MOLU|nr:ABC transporter ATP-binding protein [Spiroplasma eriocheiris]AHF57542.1 ABC-type transport system ATP-binding protein [Spiroplasma eriocheiris CCTCC M 207170]AKM53998.1 ABC transporter ATP-binding protein [Spiroplasma eriocheiris]